VLFVVESGTAPARQSKGFPLPIPVNRTWILIPISFPVMVPTGSAPLPGQLGIDGDLSLPVARITSIDLMARRALKDEMPGIMLRGMIRSAAKAVAQYQMQQQAQNNDNALLSLAALALTIGSVVTESADERTWRTLPSEIAIARGRVHPGTHSVTLQTPAGPRTVQVAVSGRYAVVGLRLLGSQLFLEPPETPAPAASAASAPSPPADGAAKTSDGAAKASEQ